MRIVMITDDVMIDRRILLEAESLINRGHEVILIAGWSTGFPEYEIIDRVKVERVIQPKLPRFFRYITNIHNMIIIWLKQTEYFFLAPRYRIIKMINARKVKSEERTNPVPQQVVNQDVAAREVTVVTDNQVDDSKPIKKRRLLAFSYQNFLAKPAIFIIVRIPTFVIEHFYKLVFRLMGNNFRDLHLKQRVLFFNPDIIHIHDLPQLRAGYKAKKALKVPLLYDAHEIYPEIESLPKKQQKKLKKLENKLISRCDAVITVNEFIAETLTTFYRIPLPYVIYNAIDANNSATHNLFRDKLNLPTSTKILLYQGWMSKTRGLQELVASMHLVDQKIHLVLMGYGEIHDELLEIMKNYAVGDRVHIVDAVPQKELLSWTQSADAGIIPYQPIDLNNYYCSPNKLFEFIQAKLPIIANDLPFLRKVIVNNEFGIVEKMDSIEMFAYAINRLFEDEKNLITYKQNLIKEAHKFSWKVEEEKLLNIYHSVASHHVV